MKRSSRRVAYRERRAVSWLPRWRRSPSARHSRSNSSPTLPRRITSNHCVAGASPRSSPRSIRERVGLYLFERCRSLALLRFAFYGVHLYRLIRIIGQFHCLRVLSISRTHMFSMPLLLACDFEYGAILRFRFCDRCQGQLGGSESPTAASGRVAFERIRQKCRLFSFDS
jgi:hypothetical protein